MISEIMVSGKGELVFLTRNEKGEPGKHCDDYQVIPAWLNVSRKGFLVM